MIALFALALAGAPPAAAEAGPPPADSPPAQPLWTGLPTQQDLADIYPKPALARGVGGRAVLKCKVDAKGFLANCIVDSEYPGGQSFGDAALALQGKFQMRAAANSPYRQKGWVRIPIRFEPPAREGPPSDHAIKLAKPDWLGRPTAEQFAKYYPEKAARQSIGGMAVAQCVVAASGKLDGCRIVYEDPPEFGFGEATLKIMPYFEARTTASDGDSIVGRTVQIPIRFGMQGSR